MSESRQAPTSILVATLIGAAVVLAAVVISSAAVRVKSSREIIVVTGSARRSIRSDFIIWRCSVTDRAQSMPEAYGYLKIHVDRLRGFLVQQRVPAADIYPLAITTREIHKYGWSDSYPDDPDYPVVAYMLTQSVEVRSKAVTPVDDFSRHCTEMISSGVHIESGGSQYMCSQIDAFKLKILGEAAADARERAVRIARSSGCQVGQLRHASMGVVQIEGLYDSEGVEDSGANDTASLDKKVTAVVHASFSIR